MSAHPVTRLFTGLATAGLCALAGAGVASAAPAPISDPQTSGYLGFCDTSGEQVRSGLLGAAPFAWKTVSSTPAPDQYAKGQAVVLAYQPRREVDPGDWSGKRLTDSSRFSNPKHPMAEGTRVDASLGDVVATFPPKLNGLYQIRMYFGAPNTPPGNRTYPAVFVRVQGQRWTQVNGGRVDCGGGKAVSAERGVLSPQQLNPSQSRPQPVTAKQAREAAARPAGSSAGSSSTAANPAESSSSSATDGAPASSPASAERGSDSDGGHTTLIVFLVVFAVLLATAGALVVRHRRVGQE